MTNNAAWFRDSGTGDKTETRDGRVEVLFRNGSDLKTEGQQHMLDVLEMQAQAEMVWTCTELRYLMFW